MCGNWKLNESGELYDMSKAPFEEILSFTSKSKDPQAIAARERLQKVLDRLNPTEEKQMTELKNYEKKRN